MGNELVMGVVPSETFMASNLVVWDGNLGVYLRVQTLCTPKEWIAVRRDREALVRKFPGAHFRVPIELANIWHPPREPHGLDDSRQRKARVAHRRAVRADLESFLNRNLARLDRLVRTGWWILDHARVKTVRFADVPARPKWAKREKERLVKMLSLDARTANGPAAKAGRPPRSRARRMPTTLAEFKASRRSVEERQLEELRSRGYYPTPARPAVKTRQRKRS